MPDPAFGNICQASVATASSRNSIERRMAAADAIAANPCVCGQPARSTAPRWLVPDARAIARAVPAPKPAPPLRVPFCPSMPAFSAAKDKPITITRTVAPAVLAFSNPCGFAVVALPDSRRKGFGLSA